MNVRTIQVGAARANYDPEALEKEIERRFRARWPQYEVIYTMFIDGGEFDRCDSCGREPGAYMPHVEVMFKNEEGFSLMAQFCIDDLDACWFKGAVSDG